MMVKISTLEFTLVYVLFGHSYVLFYFLSTLVYRGIATMYVYM